METEEKKVAPDVSIIVPIYNVELFLARCVDSILAQDFDSYEILLIDDGSTDSSGKIAERYSCKFEKIKCFHKENGGLSDARNYGIELARGRYYAFIDSDDIVSHSFISSMYGTAIKYDADIVICGYKTFFEKTPEHFGRGCSNPVIKTGEEALRRLFVNREIDDVVAWNKLYKAKLFSQGIRYSVGKVNEDVWTTYKLYSLSNRVAYVDDILYGYYQRDGSIIHTFSAASLEVTEAASDARKWLGSKAIELHNEIDWFELRLFYRTLCRILDNKALPDLEAEYKRLSQKITLGNLLSNPYGTAQEKALMWLTAHSPALVSAIRSARNK